ncbi:protein kinase domain-containing protein [Archangium lansingense]|uniref:protein kinase domain-containing protein n=1 Tax=Archangium lansingense TaxID=2995310 RepID=UPI003B775805
MRSESDFDDSLLLALAHDSTPPPSPRVGAWLGGPEDHRFQIREMLGAGAMGEVFRAWDSQLQRFVALKFLRPQSSSTELLLREARAIARLNHENIVRIHDVAEWREGPFTARVPFLVMECLAGESLSSLLRRGGLGLRRAVEILRGVAAGLAHAHAHHVIHRDLKPGNVFLTREGRVTLLDFGLAHLAAQSSDIPQHPRAGTPLYMAPEQWMGGPQDEHTDVWAAGVLFYELLTGKCPYVFSSWAELREQVLSPELAPSVRELLPELPEEVARLLTSMLAREPSQRPSSAELHERLLRLEEVLGPWREMSNRAGPERRQVTLLACRLAGLSELAQRLGSEEMGELVSAFHRLASRFILQQGGLATLFLDEEVLACFGYPLAREEDSERAVHAGLRLTQALLPALGQQFPGVSLAPLAVQVGLHTDSVVFDDLQPELRGRTLSIQGEAPRVASALARRAEPGTMLLSGATWSLVPGAFEAEARGPLPGEGLRLRRPVDVWRVVGARKLALRFERARATRELTPLVGRARELAWLQECWERARQGQGTCVLLEGEAGTGKSRLLLEWCERVRTGQGLPFIGQCWQQTQASAFAPLVEMLRNVMRLDPEAPPEQNLLWVERRMALRGLSPEQARWVASLLALPVPEESPHLQLTPQRRKEETLRALVELLWHIADEGPVLSVMEDLHWADPSTLEYLCFVLERLASHPVLVLLSARPEFRPPWPAFPWVHRLSLARLTPRESAVLVRETAGGRFLPEETVRQLVERTDGIPLFVEEMTRQVVESASGTHASIPANLRELLLARLDALSPARRALVQLCAVVGRGFSFSLLRALTGRGERELREDLEGLMEVGLLEPQAEAAEQGYQFRHALIQEAAWQSQLRGTRRLYHQRIAQTLADQFHEEAEGRPEVLAWHYTQAGENELALRWWVRAGTRALQRSANLEAISHFQQGLELARALPEPFLRRCEEMKLLFALGIPLMQSQGFASLELERTYERARELFLEVMDVPGQVALPDWSWGPYSYFFARSRFTQAQELARKVVEVGRRQDNREVLALGHRMEATVLFTQGHMMEALANMDAALAYSDFSLEQHRLLAVRHWVNPRVVVLAYASVVHSALGHPELAEHYGREAVALAREIAHPHTLAYVLAYVGFGCQFRRDLNQVLERAEECIAVSQEHHFLLWHEWSTINRSWVLALQGHTEENRTLRSHLQKWQALGLRAGMPAFHCMLAESCLRVGECDEAVALVRKGLEWAEATGERSYEAELHRLEGEGLRRLGREEVASRCFLRALVVARRQRAFTFELRTTTCLCRQLRDLDKWRVAHQRLSRACRRFEAGLDSADLREARELLAQLA